MVSTGLISPVVIVDALGNPIGSWSAVMPIQPIAFGARVFYVDPNSATAYDVGNTGQDWQNPLLTVTAAVALTRDHMGDTIFVRANDAWQYAPHHTPLAVVESVVIPATKGGIRIIGCGTNPFAALWEAGANNEACLTVEAIDVTVEGFAFMQVTYTGTTGIVITWNAPTEFGENMIVRNCVFSGLPYGIVMDYSWYNLIEKNHFYGNSIAALFNSSVAGDADYISIHDNVFRGNALAMVLLTSDFNDIRGNRIYDDPTATNNYIDLTGGNGSLVTDNYLGCTIAQYDTTCTGGAADMWINNHCTDGSPAAAPA